MWGSLRFCCCGELVGSVCGLFRSLIEAENCGVGIIYGGSTAEDEDSRVDQLKEGVLC
jgi:hypothetical protein